MKTLNVIVAEDHSIVRDGIKLLLESDNSIAVVGVATNGTEVLERIEASRKADVLLTDIQMPGIDGITLINSIKEINPDIKIIVLSMHNDIAYVTEAFARGASGYLLKECNAEELLFAVKNVGSGGIYLSMDLSEQLVGVFARTTKVNDAQANLNLEFSERELEVLQLISEGLTNNEMS
ncbi:MAG TPA: response regulator transcription factor, partial [Pedobacter sp.]|nr:response regulator transcription factor [Pedobacter sp.]